LSIAEVEKGKLEERIFIDAATRKEMKETTKVSEERYPLMSGFS